MKSPLPPEKLRRSYARDHFELESSADIEPGTGIIGQPRGVQGIEFGLNMQQHGYNIYVLGESGTGRTTAIKRYVEGKAAKDPIPDDWVYVNNFLEPQKPSAIRLPPGEGSQFRDAVQKFIGQLRTEIAQAFDNQSFRDSSLEIRHQLDARRNEIISNLQDEAEAAGALLLNTPEGFQIVPASDGKPLQQQEFNSMSDEELATWNEVHHDLEHKLNEVIHQARKLESAARDDQEALKRRVAGSVVDVALEELKGSYVDFEKVTAYLDQLHQDILDHVDLFRIEEDEDNPDAEFAMKEEFRRYQVNVLVDQTASEHSPVVLELNPSTSRLLGRIDHEARYGGAVVTDFTLIRSGTLHEANGGYLVLRARDLFNGPESWDVLKRTLLGGEIQPDDPAARRGAAARSLDPEAIPLKVKVILIGPPGLYYDLHARDEDFRIMFKVMAEFDQTIPRTADNEFEYARFIATRSHEEELLHLDRQAIGRVIEYGSRLAGTQNKLSARFGNIADLVREANYWATTKNRKLVTVDDVEKAIDQREYLHNRIETQMREHLVEGKQLVTTSGSAAGQINGLTVSEIGEHAFGHVSRVTARTYVGKEGVVQIDREVELAGQIHNKGLMTLVGYLGGQYAGELPLALSAQLTFEQSYGAIEGDSASSTELYALLSSLSGFPINQAIAVTGSVNQLGQIQAIGAVTQKVEGWFAICRELGLTGEQGVIIPSSNVQDLMLRVALTEAVAEGKFHVWAVDTVDEGIEILTGKPAKEVHDAVGKRLRQLAESLEKFRTETSE